MTGPRILIVDDEASIRTLAELSLTSMGAFTVLTACCGAEAIELAREHHPDLVLLDFMMPKMNGLETLKAIHNVAATSGTPIAMLTARTQASDIEGFMRAGAIGVITKPFNPMTLHEQVTALLKTAGEQRADDAEPPSTASSRPITQARVTQPLRDVDFAEFFNRSLDLLCVIDFDGTFLAVNDQWQQLLGRSMEDLAGHTVFDFAPPGNVPRARSELAKSTGGVVTLNYRSPAQLADGTWRTFEWNGVPRPELRVIYATGRDITERLALERQLEEAQQRFEAVLLESNDAIIAINPRGEIIRANAATERMFGWPTPWLLGKNVSVLMPEPYRSEHPGYLARYLETGERRIIGAGREVVGRRHDGSVFPIELSVSEITIGDDTVFCGTIRDLSERQRIERLKDDLVAVVSHELRTPMTAIKGALGLVLGGAAGTLPAEAIELLEIAFNNTDRLVRLVNDMLDLEKINAGNLAYQRRDVDVVELVREQVDAMAEFARDHGATVVFDAPEQPSLVCADRDRIAQVLVNLLSNGIKYTSPGGPVTVHIDASGDQVVRIAVSDDGDGIPDAFHEHVFDRFTQADSSDTRAVGGTGLGLNISREIVAAHDGTIGFDTEPGVGTTFWFDLPRSAPITTGEALDVAPVLVMESDQDDARRISRSLRSMGLTSDVACCGTDAQRLLLDNSYSAVAIALAAAGDAPLELLPVIQTSQLQRIPVIATTATAAIRIDAVIDKPLEHDAMARSLCGLLRSTDAGERGDRPRVLHVESSVESARQLRVFADGHCDVVAAPTIDAARTELDNGRFDIVVVDLDTEHGAGIELMTDLAALPTTPIVVCSGHDIASRLQPRIEQALQLSGGAGSALERVLMSSLDIPTPTLGSNPP